MRVSCQLIDISDMYRVGQVPADFTKLKGVEFEINPVSISRALSANYSDLSGIGTRQNTRQYFSSTRKPVVLAGCVFHSSCKNSDKQKYLDQFESLLFAKVPNTHPPILALVFGKRVIQPVILTDLTISETSWSNGYVSSGTFDLTLEYVQVARKVPRVTQDPKPTKREEAKKKPKKLPSSLIPELVNP